MKSTLALSILLAALLLGACAPQGGPAPQGSWVLTSLDGNTQVGALVGSKDITLEFGAESRVAGSAGCNQYNAGYSLAGQSISFSQAVSTLMACQPEVVMQNEAAFLQALAAVSEFQLAGDTLTLSGNGHTLVLTR